VIGTEAQTPAPVEKRKRGAGGESAQNVDKRHVRPRCAALDRVSAARCSSAVRGSRARLAAGGAAVVRSGWAALRAAAPGKLIAMRTARIRGFHDDDLDQVVRVWEESRTPEGGAVHGLAEVLAAIREGGCAVVALVGEVVVGAAVTRVSGDRGWVVLLALANDWRGRGLGSAMLTELEKQLMDRGVHRLSALLAEGAAGVKAFQNCGYEQRDLTYFERVVPLQPQEVGLLGRLGGRMLPGGLWHALAGMEHEKQLIERRIVLPLVDPDLAREYGVQPARAVVLFGPPGTGKTTFAKAVASRVGWPFVEVFPSRLAAADAGQALALSETFAEIEKLEHAVVFIDEVEEIAGRRGGEPPSPLQGITNELLKIIPAFRERDGRLLVCATNFVRALDPAFLRHGRFDYVIPVGAPDTAARAAIWRRYIPAGVLERIDVDRLSRRSGGDAAHLDERDDQGIHRGHRHDRAPLTREVTPKLLRTAERAASRLL
jgi:transitional endoplasmic reticulum ATPase